MSKDLKVAPWRRAVLLLLLCVGLSSCSLVDRALGNYTGPMPEKLNLAAEAVVVRTIGRDQPDGGGRIAYMHLDRIGYILSEPRSVNRVVIGQPEGNPAADSLGLAVGDTVLIWTQYGGVYRGGAAEGAIPNWPGSGWSDYPVAIHRLIDIRRKQPSQSLN